MLGVSVSEIHGHVDLVRRSPVVRLFFYDSSDDYLALVDTACSFEALADAEFVAKLGLHPNGVLTPGVLASGESWGFRGYSATVQWLGERREITLFVPSPREPSANSKPEESRRRAAPPDGVPELIIGARLLGDTLLSVNYATNRVSIARAAA